MDLQAIGAAATMALFSALVFILAVKTWHLMTRLLAGHPSFADSVLHESAQRFRDELQVLARRQYTYLGAVVMFVVIYGFVTEFEVPALFAGYPDWQLYIVLAALLAAACFAGLRLARMFLVGRQVRFLHDANLAVGHGLMALAPEHGRVYHDVPTPAGVVDHVLVGPNGVYAITVIARRNWRHGGVRIDDNELTFSTANTPLSLVSPTAGARRLGRDLAELTGHPVQVRSVVAVPGWEVTDQLGRAHLLVNERSLPMLRGWRDRSDCLMDEEVARINEELTRRCARRSVASARVKKA